MNTEEYPAERAFLAARKPSLVAAGVCAFLALIGVLLELAIIITAVPLWAGLDGQSRIMIFIVGPIPLLFVLCVFPLRGILRTRKRAYYGLVVDSEKLSLNMGEWPREIPQASITAIERIFKAQTKSVLDGIEIRYRGADGAEVKAWIDHVDFNETMPEVAAWLVRAFKGEESEIS